MSGNQRLCVPMNHKVEVIPKSIAEKLEAHAKVIHTLIAAQRRGDRPLPQRDAGTQQPGGLPPGLRILYSSVTSSKKRTG